MKASISINDKKDFIRWLLDNHQMKIRESMWVLNYIAGHDQILKYAHFVDSLEGYKRGLSLGAHGSNAEPFRFFKENIVTTDPEKAFHDIRLNWDEDLYIELHFSGARLSPEYALVREENPHALLHLDDEAKDEAKTFLDESISVFAKENLMKQVDKALDERNEEDFYKLAEAYHQLKEK
ncbi:Uncharacterized conserved protein [Listeria grayi]|uniref:UPF0302 protein HMPREF0556_11102 n=3 Tax=Listeria grayi TaxID=1641 RepID=D7UXZ1_LISGR|nr:ReoY family proteolytic degradation factor [Listeria grayi]EFI84549.1 hypothetical protein HMPREF0556_11102 [Listeria grayi DSM 20601]EUJ27127.1 hypothetical protein LMUR_11532 [Listeria grayi FSL F6-1183]MBC1922344.1 IDEAL domain-containing protein [Listeria grayi]STY45657.1 Uncharacterized conserved protein [Listeria grayi]VEI32834.1 Uncharacterized conserved protein [Listeria grayi]